MLHGRVIVFLWCVLIEFAQEIASIFVPLEEQKLPHSSCSAGELAVAPPLLESGMASMLNSTAKQAIQANASRCRDMGESARWAIRWRYLA